MGLSLNFSVTVTQQLKLLTSRVMLENQFISIIVMGFISMGYYLY